MEFEKLDINKHDLNKVSELIYETDLELFRELFGRNKNKAQKNIKKLICASKNSFGHDKIHVVTEGSDDVLGILISYNGDEIKEIDDIKAFFNAMGIIGFLKIVLISPILNRILTTSKEHDDYYLSNISVDEAHRGKGIGTFLLKKSFELAEYKKARRIILDVTLDNEGALKLYKRVGFKVYGKKSIKWFGDETGTFNMEYKF